jgi:uncharacterized protein YbaP (TraB family)
MKRFAAFFFGFLGLAFSAWAEPQGAVEARPALWHVTGAKGSATLLGSMHMLPGNVHWQTAEIRKAVKEADVMVFEVAIDAATQTRIAEAVATRGTLPEGTHLRDLLSPKAKANLARVLASLNLPETAISNKQPWLVSLMLDMAEMQQKKQLTPGPDFVLLQSALADGKSIRYFETADEQLALLAPDDPKAALQNLEQDLVSFDPSEDEIGEMTKAWETGDMSGIDALLRKDFADYPKAKALFFTKRNKAWVEKIAAMLRENKKFFIVVGAGHLAGAEGVPALLGAKGFAVVGP